MTKMMRWFVSLVFLFLLSGCQWYGYIFQPNVHITPDQPYVEIPTGSDLQQVMNVLEKKKARYGAAGICNGGGGASALVIERAAE